MYASLVNYYYQNHQNIWGLVITVVALYTVIPFIFAFLDRFTRTGREYLGTITSSLFLGNIILVIGILWHAIKFFTYY